MSAIGNTVAENRQSLVKGHCGIKLLELVQSVYSGVLPCGEIKITTELLRQQLGAAEPGTTRNSLIALHAFDEAVKDGQLSESQITSFDTAFIVGTTVGGMCLTDELYQDTQKTKGGSEYLDSYDCASVTMYLQNRYKMRGIINTINTACSSSANAIMYGARLIHNGLAKRAIVGGVDSLAKFTINGFNALHILSHMICKPFSKDRQGLNLGEGAAFLILEKEEDILSKGVYAELSGYCNANDAYHHASLSDQGDGPFLSMKGALRTAQLDPEDIGFINAHGTGTENNDLVESRVMMNVFNDLPPFASTKSNVGHTLGAAGAIEAAFSILNLYHQEVYPGLHFSKPIDETGLIPVRFYQQLKLNHVLSNSFGFGGNCTSLIFSKV